MNSISIWFLVSIATSHYMGPMPENTCKAAGAILQGEGVVCRQAFAMTACDVAGRPGVSTACPVFDVPQVTVKKP